MKENKNGTFYSKIMLFGEYSILKGSMGLTIPYAHFNGHLDFINKESYTNLEFASRSNTLLKEYWNYLNHLKKTETMMCPFNTARMMHDLNEGMYFESTIPEGYGLGSSGALVAALYKRYVKNEEEEENEQISALKPVLAQLESFFHGTSSGIDPLICYLKHPLLLKDLQHIESAGIPPYNHKSDITIFLVNSGKPWKTAPLVDHFMKTYREERSFREMVDNELIPTTNQCINQLIDNDLSRFFTHLKKLSALQKQHLSPMIPHSIDKWWTQGLNSDEFYLKLCGSGGGGFVLGFTCDYEKVKKEMKACGLEVFPVYQEQWG